MGGGLRKRRGIVEVKARDSCRMNQNEQCFSHSWEPLCGACESKGPTLSGDSFCIPHLFRSFCILAILSSLQLQQAIKLQFSCLDGQCSKSNCPSRRTLYNGHCCEFWPLKFVIGMRHKAFSCMMLPYLRFLQKQWMQRSCQ